MNNILRRTIVKKVNKLIELFITLVILLLMLSPIYANQNQINNNLVSYQSQQDSNDIFDQATAYQLFKADPTNPTLILEQELIEKGLPELTNIPEVSHDHYYSDKLGENKAFWTIESFNDYPYTYIQISATLLAVGNYSYVYVADSVINDVGESAATTRAEDYRNEFDRNIYPSDTKYFGMPGDIDGDPKITILLLPLDGGVAGYFDPNNEYAGSTSNEREMIYVNYNINSLQYSYAVITHEFQHLIHFNYDQDELSFINEGCSEFATYAAGYWAAHNNITYFASDYFPNDPEDSLLYWNYYSDGGYDVRIDYGGAYLFMFYLAERFGYKFIRTLVAEPANGAQGIESALSDEDINMTFNEIYLNWITALTIDQPNINNGTYGFINLDIQMNTYDNIQSPIASVTGNIYRYYGFHIIKLTSVSASLLLELQNPIGYAVGFSIASHNSTGWYVSQEVIKDTTDSLILPINASGYDIVYIISSMMSDTTPYVSSSDEFGLGPTKHLDYSIYPGKALVLKGTTSNYYSDNWTYTISNVSIFDDENNKLTDDVEVYLEFMKDEIGNREVIKEQLNYSSQNGYWQGEFSLVAFDEGRYYVKLIAKGNNSYGVISLPSIAVEHIIEIDKPSVTFLNEDSIIIDVRARYTQLNAWDEFTKNAEVKGIIYDDEGTPVSVVSLIYNSSTSNWTSITLNLRDLKEGQYYTSAVIKYGERSVTSINSDVFSISHHHSTTSSTDAPYLLGTFFVVTSFAIVTFWHKKRRELQH